MKKTFFALFALLAFFACNKEEVDIQTPNQEKDNTPMSFNLSVNSMSGDAETKAALKDDWSSGDVVYIFFDAIPTKYVKKTHNGSGWTEAYPGGTFVADDFTASGPASSRNMTAVWFPQGEVTVTYAESKFSFTIGEEKIYSHYMSTHAEYDISGTMVTGTLDMEKPAGFVQFFVPGIAAGDAPAYRLMESHLTPKACDYVALAGGVTESALTAGYSLKGMAFTTEESVTGALFGGYLSTAGATTSYKFSLVKGISAANPAAEGTYTLTGFRNIASGTSMTFPAIDNAAWGTMSPFVYLGFGDIQWATGNLKDDGTIVSPLDAGDYYRWGATDVCGSGKSGDECVYDNVELPALRDIASLRSSGAWHMPSQAQFDALSSNTQQSWVAVAAGKLVTSKVNGISLFFVAADRYAGSPSEMGVWGRYWSTTPADGGLANYLLLSDWHFGKNDDFRTWGMQVRPITGAPTPAPAPWDGNLSSLDGTEPSGYATATNGMTITGTLSANVKVSIDPGATVTLDGITINGVHNYDCRWAGLTCLGDATIILKDGTTSNVKGFFLDYPGIYVPEGKTLTIQGTGSLNARSNANGAGIGGGTSINCGNIVIQGGTITATSSATGAGIGSGSNAAGGTITITGGTITANGGGGAAGIGSGVNAVCGTITISGGTITANGGDYSPGIGCGYTSKSACGDITITTGVTSVTAVKGAYAPNSIGAGSSGSCGTVTIGGVETGPITTSPFVYHGILNYATAEDVGNVVCAAGHLHIAKNPVPAGCTAVGILGKVTSTGHGLILALKDATSQTWNTINGWTSVNTYASTTLKVLPNNAARGSLTSYNTLGSTTVSNWSVAQQWDYSTIFHNLGSTANDGDYTYDDKVNAYITTGVGGDALSGSYWSATQSAGGGDAPAYCFQSDSWFPIMDKTSTKCVRPVLGF